MCSSQEVLSEGSDLTTIADGNGTIISVSFIVDWLLVVLELHNSCFSTCCYSLMQVRTRFIRGMRSTKLVNMNSDYWRGLIIHTLSCPPLSLEVIC